MHINRRRVLGTEKLEQFFEVLHSVVGKGESVHFCDMFLEIMS